MIGALTGATIFSVRIQRAISCGLRFSATAIVRRSATDDVSHRSMGRKSIWIAADRRLTANENVVTDDAVKLMRLSRTPDNALLGYSGLGQTPGGTQPSEWMNNVLRDTPDGGGAPSLGRSRS